MNLGIIANQELNPLQALIAILYGVGYVVCFIWLFFSTKKDDDLTLFGRIFMAAVIAIFAPIVIPWNCFLVILNFLVFKKKQ